MKISKKFFFLFILSFFPYSLSAWGGTEKLSDGSCKFDLETGYKSSSVYIKNNESFVIIDGGDSRYGTISTVYNTLTCEEVTSGEKVESDFSGLMERKGFKEVELINKSIIDKSFQNKITILESSDNLTVHIEPIDSSVTQELKTLLVSLSDKSVSSHINISSSAKEFLSYREFYALFSKKINNLSATEINLDYALALNSKLTVDSSIVEDSKKVILAKQEEIKIRLAKIEEEKKKNAIEYHKKMIKENLKIFANRYRISGNIYKNRISWKPEKKWDYRSGEHTITGKGTIWFEPYGENLRNGYIKGKFKNGKLIAKANLKIDGSKCIKSGFWGCKESRSARDSSIVTTQNLANSISSLSSTVKSRVYEKIYGGYNRKKSVGEKVCMSGRVAFGFIGVDISAYVESVSGDRIQLRISDTESQTPNYNGTTLRQGTIIWDDYNNWEPC
jgi:hypothetical protein